MIRGVDVYHGDEVDWKVLAEKGYRFAIIKVKEGSTYSDPKAVEHFKAARDAGIVCGGYLFFRPLENISGQIGGFIDALREIGGPQLPPAIDMEWSGKQDEWREMPLSQRQHTVGLALMVARTCSERHPLLYCGKSWVDEDLGGRLPSDTPDIARLWVADYRSKPPFLPFPFTTWTFWQDGEGAVPGCARATDMDWFNGDEAALASLVKVRA